MAVIRVTCYPLHTNLHPPNLILRKFANEMQTVEGVHIICSSGYVVEEMTHGADPGLKKNYILNNSQKANNVVFLLIIAEQTAQ